MLSASTERKRKNLRCALEQVFVSANIKAATKKCKAMDGLIREPEDIISETGHNTITRDAVLIKAAQKGRR